MDSDYPTIERRRFKRLRASFLIVYRIRKPWEVLKQIGPKERVAVMYDISEGGMAILTNYDIPLATTLSLRFTLINPHIAGDNRVRTLDAIGDVPYNIHLEKNEHRLGVCFTNISDGDRSAIANLVRMTPSGSLLAR